MSEAREMELALGGSKTYEKIIEETLSQRKIVLNANIDENILEDVILQIMKFNVEDKGKEIEVRQPIFLYVNSCGGDVTIGSVLCDVIKASKTPVYGVTIGYGYSMGALIFISTHKRYMFNNSSLLIHDGNTSLSGSANKVKDLQKFYNKMDERIKALVLSNSKISEEDYDDNIDRELYMYSDECKEKGLCDFIIGIDCEMDEVL